MFKRIVGVTPRAFAAGLRTDRVQASLQNGATVTETVYSAGYGASSRFYEEAPGVLGMAPSDYRNGARGQTIRMAISPTYLGYVLVAATENGICAIELGDAPGQLEDSLRERFSQAHFVEVDAKFQKWVDEVVAFLEAPRRELSLPLDIQGTAFQRRVWEALRTIPVGTTTTYSQVAEQIGQPKAARAVAGACAANTLAAAIPCHRVIRQDGGLSDYRWGVERKKKLLERETTVARPSES